MLILKQNWVRSESLKRCLWPGILHLGYVLTVMNGSSGCEHLQYTMQERNETGLLPGRFYLPWVTAWQRGLLMLPNTPGTGMLSLLSTAGWRKSCLLTGCRQGGGAGFHIQVELGAHLSLQPNKYAIDQSKLLQEVQWLDPAVLLNIGRHGSVLYLWTSRDTSDIGIRWLGMSWY